MHYWRQPLFAAGAVAIARTREVRVLCTYAWWPAELRPEAGIGLKQAGAEKGYNRRSWDVPAITRWLPVWRRRATA